MSYKGLPFDFGQKCPFCSYILERASEYSYTGRRDYDNGFEFVHSLGADAPAKEAAELRRYPEYHLDFYHVLNSIISGCNPVNNAGQSSLFTGGEQSVAS